MDDRDLEARLRAHLHRGLDGIEPSRELRAGVEQAMAMRPTGVGSPVLRLRAPRIGWSAAVAVGAVAVVAVVGLSLGLRVGPTGVGSSPSPSAGPTERSFIVLPPSGGSPTKAESIVAGDVLSARLRFLGNTTFSLAGGYAMTFTIEGGGPSDETIRVVLAATGDVAVVPLPAADYGNGKLTAVIGQPLPKAEPPLFGREDIVEVGLDDASPAALVISLTPAATQALADYTSGHVGEVLAILVDSKVAILVVTHEPITGGRLTIQSGPENPPFLAEGVAIMVGGELPEAWRGAAVPVLITEDAAVSSALAAASGGTLGDAGLNGELIGGSWRAVWNVAVNRPGCSDVGSCPNSDSILVKIDATTGSVIAFAAPTR